MGLEGKSDLLLILDYNGRKWYRDLERISKPGIKIMYLHLCNVFLLKARGVQEGVKRQGYSQQAYWGLGD